MLERREDEDAQDLAVQAPRLLELAKLKEISALEGGRLQLEGLR